jgi:RNA methyltransferase, TrmH family
LQRRKDRERTRQFLAEGPQAVREAIAADAANTIFVDDETLDRHAALLEGAEAGHAAVFTVDAGQLAGLADTINPQGIVAVCSFLDVPGEGLLASDARLLACCAAVRDPGNAGTVLRCADAFGADGVFLTVDSVDPYNPKAVRASAGSLFHVPLVLEVDLVAVTAAARAGGMQVLAADGSGDVELPQLQASGGLRQPTVWLFGNEAWGLPGHITALADERVRVPIFGRAESLNLATAAAVCLYASATAQQ